MSEGYRWILGFVIWVAGSVAINSYYNSRSLGHESEVWVILLWPVILLLTPIFVTLQIVFFPMRWLGEWFAHREKANINQTRDLL